MATMVHVPPSCRSAMRVMSMANIWRTMSAILNLEVAGSVNVESRAIERDDHSAPHELKTIVSNDHPAPYAKAWRWRLRRMRAVPSQALQTKSTYLPSRNPMLPLLRPPSPRRSEAAFSKRLTRLVRLRAMITQRLTQGRRDLYYDRCVQCDRNLVRSSQRFPATTRVLIPLSGRVCLPCGRMLHHVAGLISWSANLDANINSKLRRDAGRTAGLA